MQVPYETGPGVRRNERLLLHAKLIANDLWKPLAIRLKIKFGNKAIVDYKSDRSRVSL